MKETRNIETFKVGAGAKPNDFDFHKPQNQTPERRGHEIAQNSDKTESAAERVARLTKEAHEKVLRRKKRR
jgi:hypothetical protein